MAFTAAMFWYMSKPDQTFLNRWVQVPLATLMLLVVTVVLPGWDRGSLKALLKSVSDVFPHYTLWHPSGGDLIIVSSNQPLELDYQEQLSFFEQPKIKADLSRIGIHSVEELINHILMSSDETRGLLVDQRANTDENPVVEFNAPKHLYTPTAQDNSLMLFGALKENVYQLPVVNLVREYPDWMIVPFMGIQLKHGGDSYLDPEWKVMRISLKDEENGNYRLLGGMKGEIILTKSWGDVVVNATMGIEAHRMKLSHFQCWSTGCHALRRHLEGS